LTSRPTLDYKYKQQLKHPRRYAPIRPEKGTDSIGIPGRNPSESEGDFLRNKWAESSEYAKDAESKSTKSTTLQKDPNFTYSAVVDFMFFKST
jgi:hypothetical protein